MQKNNVKTFFFSTVWGPLENRNPIIIVYCRSLYLHYFLIVDLGLEKSFSCLGHASWFYPWYAKGWNPIFFLFFRCRINDCVFDLSLRSPSGPSLFQKKWHAIFFGINWALKGSSVGLAFIFWPISPPKN